MNFDFDKKRYLQSPLHIAPFQHPVISLAFHADFLGRSFCYVFLRNFENWSWHFYSIPVLSIVHICGKGNWFGYFNEHKNEFRMIKILPWCNFWPFIKVFVHSFLRFQLPFFNVTFSGICVIQFNAFHSEKLKMECIKNLNWWFIVYYVCVVNIYEPIA